MNWIGRFSSCLSGGTSYQAADSAACDNGRTCGGDLPPVQRKSTNGDYPAGGNY
jgi:hypothetical protein